MPTNPPPVVLGLDAGTTSSKAVAVTKTGEVVASASSPPIITTAPSPGGSEQIPDEIWHASSTAIRGVVQRLAPGTEIAGISLAAQSGSVIPTGANQRPTSSAITWMDTRSLSVIGSWSNEQQAAIRQISGWTLAPGLGLATVAWLRSQFDAQDATHFRSVDDYLLHRLTDEWATNPSNAAGMQLMGLDELDWSGQLCAMATISTDQLSAIKQTGEVVGTISESAAKHTGLSTEIPVIVGGHDQTCAALGLGAADLESLVLAAGTAWVITAMTESGDIDRLPPILNVSPHFVADRWSISQNLGGFGAIINWMFEFWPQSPTLLEQQLAKSAPDLDDPYFLPALHEQDRFNWGRFTQANPATATESVAQKQDARTGEGWSSYEQARAVLESCAFEARRAIDVARLAGPSISNLTIVGGCAESDFLVGLIADLTAMQLTVKPDASWPAIGAARIAAAGIGWNLSNDHEASVRIVEPSSLDPILNERFETYCRLTPGASS